MSVHGVSNQFRQADCELQLASSPHRVQWNGRTLANREFSSCLKLRAADRKLRSGTILPQLFSSEAPQLKKKRAKKEAPAPAVNQTQSQRSAPDLSVGIAFVYSQEEGKPVPIVIRKAEYALQEECYVALLPEDASSGRFTQLGHITFSHLRMLSSGVYGSETCKGPAYESYGQDARIGKLNKIFITHIERTNANETREKYKGVGTALMQAAVEWGVAHGCEGRAALLAINNSHGFYYKLGMRAHYNHIPTHDAAIANELEQAQRENRKPDTATALRGMDGVGYAQGIDMHFPQEAIDQMCRKIAKHAIFQSA